MLERTFMTFAVFVSLLPAYAARPAEAAAQLDSTQVCLDRSLPRENSLIHCNRALEKQPRDGRLWLRRGGIYILKGRLEQALADLSRAIELYPADHEARAARGLVYFMLGRYDEQEADFELASETLSFPENEISHLASGIEFYYLGIIVEADKHFSESIRLNPGWTYAYLRRGMLRTRFTRKDFDALPDFERIIELESGNLRAYNELGYYFVTNKRIEEGIRAFDTVLTAEPKNISALSLRAQAYLMLKRFEPALADYEAALTLEPDTIAYVLRAQDYTVMNSTRPLLRFNPAFSAGLTSAEVLI